MFVCIDQGKCVNAACICWKLKPFNLAKLTAQFHQRSALISRRQTKCAAWLKIWLRVSDCERKFVCLLSGGSACTINYPTRQNARARASVTLRLALCCARIINNLISPQPVTRFETPHCSSRSFKLRAREHRSHTTPLMVFERPFVLITSLHVSLSRFTTLASLRLFSWWRKNFYSISATYIYNWLTRAATAAVNPPNVAAPLS